MADYPPSPAPASAHYNDYMSVSTVAQGETGDDSGVWVNGG
jgi:hypothetical protein